LRYGENLASGIGDGAVHLSGVIFKNAKLHNASGERRCIVGRVVFFHTEQNQQSMAYSRILLRVNDDAGAGHSLNNSSHFAL